MIEGLTFAVLLTAAGAGIAAGIVTGTVSVIKTALASTPIGNWDGSLLAFALSALLYVLAGAATAPQGADFAALLNAGLGVFLAWLTCATAAVGIHKFAVAPLIDRAQGG